MARIIGYGEDSLTYWALSTQLQQFLTNFGDTTPQANCLLIYRPSFGRSGGANSAQFGEFDAIVQSTKSTYLIESKWDGLNYPTNDVILKDVQILRHRIFKWILRKWKQLHPPSWDKFVQDNGAEFSREFDGRRLANTGTLLAKNCLELMLLLANGPEQITNVLLYFKSKGADPTTVLDERLQPLADPFELRIFGNPALNDSGYFTMATA